MFQKYVAEFEETDNTADNVLNEMAIDYEDDLFDIEGILTNLVDSSNVLTDYKSDLQKCNVHRPLTRSERKTVCNTLVDFAVKQKMLLPRGDFPRIVDKIQFIFKKEPAFLYYAQPNKKTKHDSKDKKKSRNNGPKGQLYTSYRFRINRQRKILIKNKQSTAAYYRYLFNYIFILNLTYLYFQKQDENNYGISNI